MIAISSSRQRNQLLSLCYCATVFFSATVAGSIGCDNSQSTTSEENPAPVANSSENDLSSGQLSSKLNDYFEKGANGSTSGSILFGDEPSETNGLGGTASDSIADNTTADDQPNNNTLTENDSTGSGSSAESMLDITQQTDATENATDDGKPGVDVNRLISRIGELTEVQRTAETTDVMRETLIEQADLARQIFESSTSFQFKITAVKTRIHALTILDRLKEPNAVEDLEAFCKELLGRSEPELQKMGLIGLVSSKLRGYLMDPASHDFQSIVDTVDQYTKDVDDLGVGQELTAAASQLFTNRKREQAVQLMSVLSKNFRGSSNPQVVTLADTLSAQMAMATANFDKAVAKQIADEEGNMQHLNDTMDQIMSQGVTLELYNELVSWLQLFEREARYKSIDLIAKKLEEDFRKQAQSDPDKFVQVLDTLDLVRTRMALVGQPFSFEGIELADGKPFDPKSIEGKIVLISFWSGAASPEERLQLQFETKSYEQWRPAGLVMVGFNMDEAAESAQDFFGSNPPRWINTKSDDNAELGYASEFAQRAVADQTPYRILLDQNGTVVYVGVPVEALATRISSLLKQLPPPEEKTEADSQK